MLGRGGGVMDGSPHSLWRIVGMTIVVVLGLAALVQIALIVLFMVSLNSWGSNK
jgi:hypothetical protein